MTKTPAWGSTRESVAAWCSEQDVPPRLYPVDALHISILVNGNQAPDPLCNLARDFEQARHTLELTRETGDTEKIREAWIADEEALGAWHDELRAVLHPEKVTAEQDKILTDAGIDLD